VGPGPDAVRRLGEVRARAIHAGSAARGPETAEQRHGGRTPPDGGHDAVGGYVAGRPAGRRPVPRPAVLRPAGHHCAVPRHDEHGQVAEVVGLGAVPERHADHLAGGP